MAILAEDWIIPVVMAGLILGIGTLWAIRLYRQSRRSPRPNPPEAAARQLPEQLASLPRAAVTACLGVLFACLCWWALPHVTPEIRWSLQASIGLGCAAVLVGAALHFRRRSIAMPALLEPVHQHQARIPLLVFGLLLSIGAALLSNYGDRQAQLLASACWATGIMLAVLASWRHARASPSIAWQTIAWMTLLIVGAFLARGLSTGTVPAVLSGDEASVGLSALRFLDGNTGNLFGVGWHAFPSLYYFVQAISISLLGMTTQALRLPSALVGALTVGAVYLMGRSMFSPRAGLLAACILMLSHVHIHFSRLGLNNVWDGLLIVATLGAFWRGWKTGERNAFLLGGLCLGLSLYFYASARVLFVLLPAWLGLLLILHREQVIRRLPDFGLAAWVAVCVALPLAWYYTQHPRQFTAPMRVVSILNDWLPYNAALTGMPVWRVLLRQFTLGFRAYVDVSLNYFYIPGTPILRLVQAVVFLLGMALLLARPRDARGSLLVLWLAAFGVIGAVTESTPAAQRYVAAIPACALVIGYALSTVGDWAARLAPQWTRLSAAVLVVVTLALALDDARFYFLDYTPRSDFGGHPALIAQRLTDRLDLEGRSRHIVYVGDDRFRYYANPSLIYLASEHEITELILPWGTPENRIPQGDTALFVVLPGSRSDLDRIRSGLPCGELGLETLPGQIPLYWYFECDLAAPAPEVAPLSFRPARPSAGRRGETSAQSAGL